MVTERYKLSLDRILRNLDVEICELHQFKFDPFWSVVLIGIVPAAISGTLLPTHWCLNIGDLGALIELPPVGCLGGRSIAAEFLSPPVTWLYLVALAVALLVSLRQRKNLRLVALLPLLAVTTIPFLHHVHKAHPEFLDFLPSTRVTQLSVNPSLQENRRFFDGELAAWTEKSVMGVVQSHLPVEAPGADGAPHYLEVQRTVSIFRDSLQNLAAKRRGLRDAQAALKRAKQELQRAKAEHQEFSEAFKKIPKFFGNNFRDKLREKERRVSERESQVSRYQASVKRASAAAPTAEGAVRKSLRRLNRALNVAVSERPARDIRLWTIVYSIASFFALAAYTFLNPLRAAPFALAVTATFAIPLVTQLLNAQAITVGSVLLAIALSLYPTLLYLLAAIGLRLISQFYVQNRPLAGLLGRTATARLLVSSAFKWIPIGAALTIGLYFAASIDQLAGDAVYELKCEDEGPGFFQCFEPDTEALVPRDSTKSLEENIVAAVDRGFVNQEKQLEQLLSRSRTRSAQAKKDGPGFILTEYDAIFPTGEGLKKVVPSLRPPSCRWYQIGCRITREIKIAVVDSYHSTRNRYRASVERKAEKIADQSGETINTTIDEIDAELSLAMHSAKLRTKSTIEQVFWADRAINLVFAILLIVIAIKSFAYVLARIVFGTGKLDAYTIQMDDTQHHPPRAPEVRSGFNPEYELQRSEFGRFYVKPSLSPSGRSQSVSWPQPFRAVLRRLLSGSYKMVALDPAREEPGAVTIRETEGKEFVEWILGPDDEVFFSIRNLAAFSETTGLRTCISLNIMAMAYGQMIFSVARGPGILLLRTHGKPDIFVSDDPGKSVDARRYIAWSDKAAFVVSSSSKLVDIYLHSAQLSYVSGGAAVVDVSEEGRRRSGAIRFIPPVLLPV